MTSAAAQPSDFSRVSQDMLIATVILLGVWKGSIDDRVRHDPRLTNLARLIDASGYQPMLAGSSTKATLFAPVDAAFSRLSGGKAILNTRRLAGPVLEAHLLRDLYGPISFTNGTSAVGQPLRHDVRTMSGGHLRTVVTPDGLRANGARILGEIRATNGIILLVDRVLPLRLDPPRREGIAHEPPAELFRWGLAVYEQP